MSRKRHQPPTESSMTWYRWAAVGAVGVGFFALLVYVLLFKDEIRQTEVDVPLISAPDRPVKRRPDNPGGLDIPNRDKTVYDLLAPDIETAEAVTPAPSKPAPVEEPDVAEEKAAEPVEAKPAPAPKVAEVEPAPAPAPATAQGDWGVQLASFVNQADADRAIATYQQKYGELKTLTPRVQKVTLGQGKGDRYRAQFLGLLTKQAAENMCKQLEQKNQGCLRIKR